MHICHESNKTVTGPISARIVALYHQNRQLSVIMWGLSSHIYKNSNLF